MKDFIREAFGERLSFIIGWLYCFMWLTVCVIEVLAAGSFLQYWLPDAPLWLLTLGCAALVLGINMLSVSGFGEAEFWLAGIKIGIIIVFIVLGVLFLSGVWSVEGTGDCTIWWITADFCQTAGRRLLLPCWW